MYIYIFTFLILFASPFFIGVYWRLFVAIPLSVFQFYIPGFELHGYPPPLALFGALALWPEFFKGLRILLRWPPTLMLIGVLAMYALSLSWSADIRMGLRAMVYLWVFLAIFSAFSIELEKNPSTALSLLYWTVGFGLIQAMLVIAFRLDPNLELLFLHSSAAQWFINPNAVLGLFGADPNNVLDPAKSGGFFLNGNVAGTYLGMLSVIALGLGISLQKRCLFIVAFLLIMSVYFSGSKAAILLALFASSFVLLVVVFKVNDLTPKLIGAVILVLQIVLFFGLQSYGGTQLLGNQTFLDSALSTTEIRLKIWNYGLHAFLQHPVLGQGFGGWQAGFASYAASIGISGRFPPHNTLIYLWSQGGLFAALFGFMFMSFVVFKGARLLIKWRQPLPYMLFSAFISFVWVFVHGMGTNFGLVGDPRMIPLLAALLALIFFANAHSNSRPSQ